MTTASPEWWQHATVYQIYPRSFQDRDGDGVGDLAGIRSRLDYLTWLGVDAIWISPVYLSPMVDFGYDVSDHRALDPLFGTMAEFDELLAEAHRQGLKLVLDFVHNHTSDQHPWFEESRSSRQSPKRDWYIWRDPAPGGGPPSNWISNFGSSSWAWDDRSGQYYFHAFLKEQPDLNWRNPEVREAMFDVMRFWLAKGVDGFRVDAAQYLVEDDLLRDNPQNPAYRDGMPPSQRQRRNFTSDRPETLDCVAELRRVLDEFPDRVLIGEVHLTVSRLVDYYGQERPGFQLPFNFELIKAPWQARSIDAAIDRYLVELPRGAWPNWVLGNHDEPRVASRNGEAQARVAAMLQMTLPGTMFIYNGEELGLCDVPVPDDRQKDPLGRLLPGYGLGRDPQRSPMPWDGGDHAGFTTGEPWLPLGPGNEARNVARQREDPGSMLHLYRRLLELRRSEPALTKGEYVPVPSRGDVLTYERSCEGSRIMVCLNFGREEQEVVLPCPGRIRLSTSLERRADAVADRLVLGSDEGLVVALVQG